MIKNLKYDLNLTGIIAKKTFMHVVLSTLQAVRRVNKHLYFIFS